MINVTQPFLPPLDEFILYLKKIWANKWLTNSGEFHRQLEKELSNLFNVPYVALFNNGTNALLTALQALDISGEVITTPYTFIATANSLIWNNLTPVFVDIDPDSMNISPEQIELAITPKTSAILGVHVYGNPCYVDKINEIAKRYHLKVIYDAAHAFGVEYKDKSILTYGDLSVLSFHATKVFNTFEGGAIICHSLEMKQKIDQLKNFGLEDETTVNVPGLNGKMNEVQASMGLLQLQYLPEIFSKREEIANYYTAQLSMIGGIDVLKIPKKVKWNCSYYPIIVNKEEYGIDRNRLNDILLQMGIKCRKYFYPIVTEFNAFQKSKIVGSLQNALNLSENVLCLPIYPGLKQEDTKLIISIIASKRDR